jgi:drug/metabolite transporter (DMT)-like permease
MQFTKDRKIAYTLLLITTIIWGAAPAIVKNSYEVTTPFRFLFYRYIVAFVCSIPIILYYYNKVKNTIGLFSRVILLEFIGVTLSLGLLYIGLDKTTSIESGLIVTAGPIFTIIGGIIFLKEREEKNEIIGLVIALAGTILLTIIPLLLGQDGKFKFSIEGNLILIAVNIVTAVYYLLAKKYYKGYPKFYLSSISFLVGLVSFFILALIEAHSLANLTDSITSDLKHFSVIFASVYMGTLGSIIALTFYIIGQDKIEASEASLINYLQPIIFIPLGVLWLGEAVHPLQITALIVILAGVVLGAWKGKRRRR